MDGLIALLGLGVGGLINMLADCLPLNRRLVLPHCPACTAPRPFAAWFGIGALIARAWRCPYCGTPRSWRVPLIEVVTVVGAIWLYRRDPTPISFWLNGLVLGFFILIVVIDVEHRLILHIVTGPAALIFGLIGVLKHDQELGMVLLGGLTGFGLVLVLYLFGWVFAHVLARLRGKVLEEVAFGFGDVTLAGVLGLIVGFYGVLMTLFIGILAAGIFSLVYLVFMLLRHRYQAFLPVPYGPFLVLGASMVYFGGRTLIEKIFPYGPLWLLGVLIVYFVGQAAIERFQGR